MNTGAFIIIGGSFLLLGGALLARKFIVKGETGENDGNFDLFKYLDFKTYQNTDADFIGGSYDDYLLGESANDTIDDKGIFETAYLGLQTLDDETPVKNDPAKLDPKNLLNNVHPDLSRLMREAHKQSPNPFRITSGHRTQEEQNALYAQGRTAPGTKVTWTLNSKHIGGFAVDIYVTPSPGKQPWDVSDFKLVAAHIKSVAKQLGIGVKWGGDFSKNKDYPHYELTQESTA